MHPPQRTTKTSRWRREHPSSSHPPAPHPFAFVALVVANVALAFGPWFVRMADTGPVAAAFWRIALATPFLCALAFAAGSRPTALPRLLWAMLALAGISFALDLGAWHVGILHTTLANATLFGNSATLFFPLYGFAIARAWPTRTQGFALMLAAAGAALLMGRSYELNPKHLAGDLFCILAGLLYTVYLIVMTRTQATVRPMPALALSTVASIGPLLILSLAMGEQVWPDAWGPLLGLAIVSQVIGQGCMIFALGQLPPLVVGIALLLQPVVAGTVGWIVYHERLGAPDLIGVALVAAALVLVRRAREVEPADDAPILGAKDR